jgi:hypothetical protein
VAGYDYHKGQRVQDWPLYEVLYAFEALLKDSARESYYHTLLMYSIAKPHDSKQQLQPPRKPGILED